MRIDTSEPALIHLFEKGQVGLIRTEFMRQFDVIERLALQKAELAAENERLREAGDAMYNAAVQDSTGLWVSKPFDAWRLIMKERDSK